MIVVHITPTGIEKVLFRAANELEEDMSLAAWPLVRKELKRLDQKLRNVAENIVDRSRATDLADGLKADA